MPLDPVIAVLLEKAAAQPAMHTLPVDTVRAGDLARYARVERPEVAEVGDRVIAGPRGDLRVRIYKPASAGPAPVLVYFHGGGFVICSIDTHDGLCRQVCSRAGVIVVSVDYGLAPENKYPKALEDCVAATRWVAENAGSFGGDPDRIGVGGDSSGGNMATVTSMRLRDEGGPRLAGQLLIYPVTDHHSAGMKSYEERGKGFGVGRETMRWFWNHYLDDDSQADDPHVSPNRSANLAGLPPAFVMTAEYDPLRDEGRSYANKLAAAGVPTTSVHYDDVHHGFLPWAGIIGRSEEALRTASDWLRRTL